MLNKARVVSKAICLTMFKDKDSILGKQVVVQHEIRNGGKILQCIRRISKNKVELQVTAFQEFKNVTLNKVATLIAKCLKALTNEARMIAVFLHTYHLLTTS